MLALRNVAIWSGDFAGAASLIAEAEGVAAATGSRLALTPRLTLAAAGRGSGRLRDDRCKTEQATNEGQGLAATDAHWAAAVLYNGLGRYEEAAAAARQATSNTFEPWISMWALPELVEAASRIGDAELARDALKRLVEATQPCGTEFARGIEAR